MHMHAWTSALRDPDGKLASIPCLWPDCASRPTVVCTDDDVRDLALEAMDRHNVVLAVVTEMNLDRVYEWADAAPGRFLAGAAIGEPAQIDTAFLRAEFAAGRLQVIGEIGSQCFGFAPNDPSLEPVFALAERLGVPTLIHVEGIAAPVLVSELLRDIQSYLKRS
jgi:predicted TIM-barrel fold metal-dependent hydrolase